MERTESISDRAQISPCPDGSGRGCNPDFLNIDLTATKKFGKWEIGKRRYLQGGTNGRSVKAVSLLVQEHQGQAERGTRSQAARLARKCPSAFFSSLAASAMLSKKTGERSTGADLPAQ
jgi:hypothetical protein